MALRFGPDSSALEHPIFAELQDKPFIDTNKLLAFAETLPTPEFSHAKLTRFLAAKTLRCRIVHEINGACPMSARGLHAGCMHQEAHVLHAPLTVASAAAEHLAWFNAPLDADAEGLTLVFRGSSDREIRSHLPAGIEGLTQTTPDKQEFWRDILRCRLRALALIDYTALPSAKAIEEVRFLQGMADIDAQSMSAAERGQRQDELEEKTRKILQETVRGLCDAYPRLRAALISLPVIDHR